MKKDKKKKKETPARNDDYIEFVLAEETASSPVFAPVEEKAPVAVETRTASTTLEEMPPVFRELAEPKLPELSKEDRARLQMQSPNRLFFYWSLGSNPFHRLNRALGAHTASYTLVLKLVDLKREAEQIHPVEAEGSWWFDVEADSRYRAEIGFYAPNRPYVRALFSNTIETPRKSPSPRVDSGSDWSVSSDRFARVLEVAGFTEDAFDVALAGDDHGSSESATLAAFGEFIEEPGSNFDGIAPDELRRVLYLIASGASLESLRWEISPALFAILQSRAGSLNAEKAMVVLKERFEIEGDELVEEELMPAVFGASVINFPKRLKTRRTLPKLRPVSSSSSQNHLR